MRSRCLALPLLLLFPTFGRSEDHFARFASGRGTLLFLAAAGGMPLLRDRPMQSTRSLRSLDTLVSAVVLSEGLGRLTRVPRPDTAAHDSFPSSHAAAAFALAEMESQWHPREAPLWFAGASVIAWSRVQLNRHRILDVAAGAALGYFTARWELSRPHGILISPLLGEGRYGLTLIQRF